MENINFPEASRSKAPERKRKVVDFELVMLSLGTHVIRFSLSGESGSSHAHIFHNFHDPRALIQ